MTIAIQTYDGAPRGSNLAVLPHEIPDDMARYIQDAWVNNPGETIRRGLLKQSPEIAATWPKPIHGITQVVMNDNTVRLVALVGDSGSATYRVLSDDKSTTVDLGVIKNLGNLGTTYWYFDSKPALSGGVLIGQAFGLMPTYVQTIGLWMGGNKPAYTTGTITTTRGSTAVTGSGTSWSANVVPGMFVLVKEAGGNTNVLAGVVASVTDNTHIVLDAGSLVTTAASATYTIAPFRVLMPRYSGYITTDSTSASVSGQNTKFVDWNLATFSYALYRRSDMTYIGTASIATSNDVLTLTANAAVTMEAEKFVAIRYLDATTYSPLGATAGFGALNAVYAGRQWYANNSTASYYRPDTISRVYFSDTSDFESVDNAEADGDYIHVRTGKPAGHESPIYALAGTNAALVVLKEHEAFAVYGTSPENFSLQKIYDDGTLSTQSVRQYQGGCLWAGYEGIYFFDGSQVINIVADSLGDAYKKMVRTFNPQSNKVYSLLTRDHYTLFFESVTFPYTRYKGASGSTPTRIAVSVYLPTLAVTFHTNVEFRGSVQPPLTSGLKTMVAVNSSAGTGYLCDVDDLWDTPGTDTIQCNSGVSTGPDFYMETKRYNLGDPLLKKLFKQMAMTYYLNGDNLKLDTVPGLNETGTTSGSEWATTSSLFSTARIKFLKRDRHLGFRIWQKSTSVSDVRIGPWQLGFKPQRAGRI